MVWQDAVCCVLQMFAAFARCVFVYKRLRLQLRMLEDMKY